MAPELPKHALIAVTSHYAPFYANGDPTGLFYTEALHSYLVLKGAGFEVDLASETGTYGIDPHSIDKMFMSESDYEIYNDKSHEFSKKLAAIRKASELNPSDYGLFFASAGHGSLFDYPTAKSLIKIAESVWERGGIVSAVCHGPAILPSIIDSKTGKSIINGKRVTGFTDKGEEVLNVDKIMRESKVVPISQGAAQAGGKYEEPENPFDNYSIVDGRLVTGTNPASTTSTATKAVEAFNAL
ncbi:class I glutamine amidotransferase-like protein [Coemansia reversa NRRL 1564]|uniref:D-lactate dehydratase n=1 Tax=Coemansia reversa (strain ATCC 12441 / NRRL 1564) TaxID=763665 RepID=A0A2G5BAN9_COERN|nr:class I glutamine amidotransferase-like protein [Coemansia reversa NRRL 1564]|eukprot:PIA16070.1 class I glutamine amidotransferase-like protein [Coemansia reversa NRRL 1564]